MKANFERVELSEGLTEAFADFQDLSSILAGVEIRELLAGNSLVSS